MQSLNLLAGLLILTALVEVGFTRATKKPKRIQGSNKAAIKALTQRIQSATPEELANAQAEAANMLESNFEKAMMSISAKSAKGVPAEVQDSAMQILSAIKLGQLNSAVLQSLPEVMVQVSAKAPPALQLQTILADVTPRAPLDIKAPLSGVMDFVKANLGGVNNLLAKVINGTPNLTQGVVTTLANTLGGVNGALTGTADSLNGLVGGLLSGGLLPAGVLPQLPGLGAGGGLLG